MNIWELLVIIVVIALVIIAFVIIRRNKGKCLTCPLSDNCPFKKK